MSPVNGPRAVGPQSLPNPSGANAAASQAAQQMPTPQPGEAPPAQMPPQASDASQPSPQMTPDDALALMGQGGAPAQPAQGAQAPADANAMSPDEALQLMGAPAAQAQAAPAAPSTASGVVGVLSSIMAPMTGILSATEGAKDAPSVAAMFSEFAKHPEGKQQIFQNLAGPGYESRVADGEVEFRKAGEADWRPVKPGWFDSLHSFVQRTANFLPEVFEGGVMAASTAAGAAIGGGEGAVAGSVVPGAGTVAGAVGGSIAGAAAAGAASSIAAGAARETVSRLLGAEKDPSLMSNLALQGTIGAVIPGAGTWLANKLEQRAAQTVVEKVSRAGTEASAIKVGGLTKDFQEVYDGIVGGSTPNTVQAGKLAATAVEGAQAKLGENVGLLWKQVETSHGDISFSPPKATQGIEDYLKDRGFRFQAEPEIIPSKIPTTKAVEPSNLAQRTSEPGFYRDLADTWNKLSVNGGVKPAELKEMLGSFQEKAAFNSLAPSDTQLSYRKLYNMLAQDRDQFFATATKGTEFEQLAKNANSDYSSSIDTLQKLSKAAEKSPDKFADSLLSDYQSAQVAKSVLGNPNPSAVEHVNGWDAVKSAWMGKAMDAAQDVKTGIVDIPKFVNQLTKKPGVAEVVLGKEGLADFQNLARQMEKITWQGLLKNPDSVQNTGMFRAITRAVMSHFNPAWSAEAVARLASYKPEILSKIQAKGIVQFAAEASTKDGASFWSQSSRALSRLMDVVKTSPGEGGKIVTQIPVARAMVPVLLNAGVRPADEAPEKQQAYAQRGYQLYQEHAAEQLRQQQAQIAQAQAQPRKVYSSVQTANAGSGVPPNFPQLNAFVHSRVGGGFHRH